MPKKVKIESATIRSWGFKRENNRIYPYFNLTINCEEDKVDYTMSSEKDLYMSEWAAILRALCVTNTRDLVNLGCRVAISDNTPFAMGSVPDGKWIVFTKDEYIRVQSDKALCEFCE